ncbi:response regulator [Fulvimonas yonginensis]|uniref:histidine kinase n=1 Tax=Fulvimonas yonginensis TaxID=1495200 RepID=A0ABU8JE22_9GAMM
MQKLETLGQLTGGVAHDFNNLLTPIVGALDMLSHRLQGDERARRLTAGGLQAAERARVLIQRLLAFSRRQHLAPRAVDVGHLLEGMGDLVARSIGPQIRLFVQCPGGLPAAMVDPNQLELALLNLAINARDAMPQGGELAIIASSEGLHGHPKLPNGRYLKIAVTDTGVGMDETTVKRAVEPFFTTKGIGRGTGLGLSSVHGLAVQSGGDFTLESAPGCGTTATLWLPTSKQRVSDMDAAIHVAAPRPRGSAIVLLVDDEELVRAGTAEMLADAGYTVREAPAGYVALQQAKSGVAFDVLVTDYAMPGMTGAELARQMRLLRPGLPILMITGYAALTDQEAGGWPRLAKPFKQIELADALSALLNQGKVIPLHTAAARARTAE